jgi:mannan endo-1,4-beta-mannosidase
MTTKSEPVNQDTTPEARALLDFLYEISGRYLMSGQHNFPSHGSRYSDKAAEIAGSYPALWGEDFGFSVGDHDDITFRQAMIDDAKRQYAEGSIITLMWHAVRPTEEEPVTFKDSIQGKVTDEEWHALVTPGTDIYERWERQVDIVARFLKQLQDSRIPVLWRPYHEMNGEWFWWGKKVGPNGYAALWKQLFERMVNHHRLHNLIWVWNANAPTSENILPYADCFPGHEYVDVLATDIYHDWNQSYYEELIKLAQGRPVAIGECGRLPTPGIWDCQPLWTWFMVWTDMIAKSNTPEAVRAAYNYPRTLNRPAIKEFQSKK